MYGHEIYAPPGFKIRVHAGDLRNQPHHLRLCLNQVDARLESCHRAHPSPLRFAVSVSPPIGAPELRHFSAQRTLGRKESYVWWHHPDDEETFAIEFDGLVDDPWIAAKSALPQSIPQENNVIVTAQALIGREVASKDWRNAQQRK